MDRHPLYDAALAADNAYSRAISVATGGRRDRWTAVPADETPEVLSAKNAKVAADTAWIDYMKNNKETR